MAVKTRATIDDLMHVPGKAELIGGEIVEFMATGGLPGMAGDAITVSLWQHARRTKQGRAVGDNKGFRVRGLPRRESFSPDAAFYVGPDPGMKFYEGAPVFAVEVRSEGDYGAQAEQQMADKRADYFLAGTLVVWDVDVLSADVIKAYRGAAPGTPEIFRNGETANAEPAVPGWTLAVSDLFE